MLSPGCAAPGSRLQYLIGDKPTLEHYRDYATSIEYPVETEARETDPGLFRVPRKVETMEQFEELTRRDIRLEECTKMALSSAAILKEDQNFGSPANPLLSNPSRVASVYDSAIQDTGILFGSRGTEAALSDFDPLFTSNIQLGRSEDPQNSPNLGLQEGQTLADNTGQFQARLEKFLANSGVVAVQHDWNYSRNNVTRLFPSAFTGSVQAEYRQPLLAGAGTEFTRTAGPLAQGIRGVSGVSQGVLISRINTDIALVDFEQSVTTLARDVETKYWDLYLSLRALDSDVRKLENHAEFVIDLGGDEPGPGIPRHAWLEAVAEMYSAHARVKGSLTDVLSAENRLRRLTGMPISDGTFLAPVDEPSEARLVPDWESSLIEALANRAELRRQKWEIRSLELQLDAARNLTRPRLDFVSQYRVNGFGNNLFGQNDDDGQTNVGYQSAYESLTQGDNTGWGLGLQFTMPVGLRIARSQVRNYELRLRKARVVLEEMEVELARELNNSILEMDRWFLLGERAVGESAYIDEASKYFEDGLGIGGQRTWQDFRRKTDLRNRTVDAKQAWFRNIVEYNKAITDYNYRKGVLLQANSIYLAEGEWNPMAYEDARQRAQAMTHAFDNTHLEAIPSEFVGGPGSNSWEATGNPNRPHIPGVLDEFSSQQQPSVNERPLEVPEEPFQSPIPAEPTDTPSKNSSEEPPQPLRVPRPDRTAFNGESVNRGNTNRLRIPLPAAPTSDDTPRFEIPQSSDSGKASL